MLQNESQYHFNNEAFHQHLITNNLEWRRAKRELACINRLERGKQKFIGIEQNLSIAGLPLVPGGRILIPWQYELFLNVQGLR